MKNPTTIMIIDDDEDDRFLFKEALKEIGAEIKCLEACNGEEGLELLTQSTMKFPDVIFLDLNMPGISGKECLVRLKKNDRLQPIPVIIYSTVKHRSDAEETKQMGAYDFIVKPATFQGICKAIDESLRKLQHIQMRTTI